MAHWCKRKHDAGDTVRVRHGSGAKGEHAGVDLGSNPK